MVLVGQYEKQIKQLCDQHNVEKLYLIGSASTDSMNESSDVDLLVKFRPFDMAQYFNNYMDLKLKFEKLFQRDIDLLEEQTLSNPFLIKSINRSKALIYGWSYL